MPISSANPIETKAPLNSPGRVIAASLVGTTVEFYDFYVYATAAALVFPKLFFPTGNDLTSFLLTVATFGVGFFMRPVGAIVLGVYADRTPDSLDDPRVETIAEALRLKWELGLAGGAVVANPIPAQFAMPKADIDAAIKQALREADEQGVKGKESTPFLLARVCELTGGNSLAANIQLVLNNAALGAKIAASL